MVVVNQGVWGREHKEPHVKVDMFRLITTGGNGVDIQIDRRCHHPQTINPGLLLGFAKRNGGEVAVTVGMSAGLQPSVELGVMEQQRLAATGVYHEG